MAIELFARAFAAVSRTQARASIRRTNLRSLMKDEQFKTMVYNMTCDVALGGESKTRTVPIDDMSIHITVRPRTLHDRYYDPQKAYHSFSLVVSRDHVVLARLGVWSDDTLKLLDDKSKNGVQTWADYMSAERAVRELMTLDAQSRSRAA